jgi:exosome complex RNA-binding protein Rrp42 (RNase PH superfamily)
LLDTSISVVLGDGGEIVTLAQVGSTLVPDGEGGQRDVLEECIESAKQRREELVRLIKQ